LYFKLIEENAPKVAPRPANEDAPSLTTKVLDKWFLSPFNGNEATFTGSRNEQMVKQAFPAFVRRHCESARVKVGPIEEAFPPITILQLYDYGLLLCKQFPRAAFSPDGICLAKQNVTHENENYTIDFLAIIEIKTKTCRNTSAKEWSIARALGRFAVVDLANVCGQETFVSVIPELEHRTQIVHGMGCGSAPAAFYIVADDHQIIRVVYICFLGEMLGSFAEHYQMAIQQIFNDEGLGWIDQGRVPKIDPSDFTTILKYAVDQHTVDQSYELCKALDETYIEKGNTIPILHRCLPASVALWNKCKGPIDLYSRHFWNNLPNQRKIKTTGATWLRMIRTAVYNAYQIHLMILVKDYLDSDDCTSWTELNKKRTKIRNKEGTGKSFQCFIGSLSDHITKFLEADKKKLIKRSDANTSNSATPKQTTSCPDQTISRIYNLRESFLQEGQLSDLRRLKVKEHAVERIDESKKVQRRCVWCCDGSGFDKNGNHYRKGYKTSFQCNMCEVPLCQETRKEAGKSCFYKWHAARTLHDPCSNHPETRNEIHMRRLSIGDVSQVETYPNNESSDRMHRLSISDVSQVETNPNNESSDVGICQPCSINQSSDLDDTISNGSMNRIRQQLTSKKKRPSQHDTTDSSKSDDSSQENQNNTRSIRCRSATKQDTSDSNNSKNINKKLTIQANSRQTRSTPLTTMNPNMVSVSKSRRKVRRCG
jgi:hypothetical protein